MAASPVEICNDALVLLGASVITSLDGTSKEAKLCNQQYEKMRDQLLLSHPWNFASQRTQLAADAALPTNSWGFTYAHTVPTDCLRILRVENDYEFVVEGGKILSNYTPLNILYIKKVTNTALFSKVFEEALAWKIAARIGYALTQSATLMAEIFSQAEEHLRNARSYNAQESSLEEVEAEDWLRARY